MPSRAVLRRKARKEKSLRRKAKLSETDVQKKENVTPILFPKVSTKSSSTTDVTDLAVDKHDKSKIHVYPGSVGSSGTVCNISSLTRKERKKMEAKKRFSKQIIQVNNQLSDNHSPASGELPTTLEEKLRHDPRFKNGTFWRGRKERRARTLYLGGMPLYYSTQNVVDFIMTQLDGSKEKCQILQEIPEGTSAVEKIDLLPLRVHSNVRNMFVSMCSVSVAKHVAKLLDGYKIEAYSLRCNFVADKEQRAEAIRRRG